MIIRNYIKRATSRNAGFTLVEALVTISIFVIVISACSSVLVSVLAAQSKTRVQRESQQSARYAMEVISRYLRNAQGSENDPVFIFGASGPVDPATGTKTATSITAVNTVDNKNLTFELNEDERIVMREEPGGADQDLTSDSVKITELTFTYSDDSVYDPNTSSGLLIDNTLQQVPRQQPWVRIKIKAEIQSSKSAKQASTELITTISARRYDY